MKMAKKRTKADREAEPEEESDPTAKVRRPRPPRTVHTFEELPALVGLEVEVGAAEESEGLPDVVPPLVVNPSATPQLIARPTWTCTRGHSVWRNPDFVAFCGKCGRDKEGNFPYQPTPQAIDLAALADTLIDRLETKFSEKEESYPDVPPPAAPIHIPAPAPETETPVAEGETAMSTGPAGPTVPGFDLMGEYLKAQQEIIRLNRETSHLEARVTVLEGEIRMGQTQLSDANRQVQRAEAQRDEAGNLLGLKDHEITSLKARIAELEAAAAGTPGNSVLETIKKFW